jgi:hypothetical protein
MRRMVIVMALVALFAVGGSDARAAPWCAHFNTGLNDCNFYTLRQCKVAVSGVGGYCAQNGFERPYWAGPDGRRRYRRDY